MGKFCKFCEAELEENTKCTCGGESQPIEVATENKEESEKIPHVLSTSSQEEPTASTIANSESIKKRYEDVKLTVKKFIENPSLAAANAEKINKATLWFLLGAQAIAFAIWMWVMYFKISSTFGRTNTAPVDMLFSTILMSALEIAVLFVSLLAMFKLFKSSKKPIQIFSSIAIASIPWTASILCISIFSLIFGMSEMLIIILVMLLIFALVSSICILETSLYDEKISSLNNLLIISVAYAVHFILFMFIAKTINEEFIASVLNNVNF